MSLDVNWDAFLDKFLDGSEELAKNALKGFASDSRKDAQAFANFSRAKIILWSKALAEEKIDQDDFEFLLTGLKTLARLHALTAKGIAQKRLDDFRTALISLLIETVFDFL